MLLFAQTNVQPINQLWRDGYSATQIGLVLTSYELATCLFSGRFRASGKTFIAHLDGRGGKASHKNKDGRLGSTEPTHIKHFEEMR